MSQRVYSSTERDRIVREFTNRSVTVRTFAKQFGIAVPTIYAWLKTPESGLKTPPHELGYHHLEARIKSLEEQILIIKSCRFFANASTKVRLAEMRRLSDGHSVHVLSAALDVSRETYYNDLLRAKGENAWFNLRRKELTPKIRKIFEASHGAYGAKMIATFLCFEGVRTSQKTVADIMSKNGMESSRNTAARTHKNDRRKRMNELKDRESEFTADAPNKIWVCDVSELFVGTHTKIFLCAVIDVFARKVVAYHFGGANNTRLTKAAFLKAFRSRNPGPGLVFHSDNGAPNVSRRFHDCLKRLGVVQSFSRPHVPQDNAVVESFFRNLKAEVYYPCTYKTVKELTDAVIAYIENYNAVRPHSFNDGLPPDEAELKHWAAGND